MKKLYGKILAIVLVVALLSSMLTFSAAASLSFDVSTHSLTEISNAVSTASYGDVITVSGSLGSLAETIMLNIPRYVTVIWQASITSALNAYVFNISGGGVFEVRDAEILSSGTRTAGVINVTGDATVAILDGAEITAVNIGNPILISANDVTVNIDGGTVLSSSRNSNAAIQVGSGNIGNIVGTKINVISGSVISDVGGYAINDGAGAGNIDNNTSINISGGIVSSGSACAIHSTGIRSSVKVSGGLVTNTAASNANPTIYINSDPEYLGFRNVQISGGKVQNLSTSNTAYAVQTTGDVYITGGGVFTINGRAVNLVGQNSSATVSGTGVVHAAGTGTAISTATTAGVDVSNTTISVINGGVASSESGNTIRVTGTYTRVLVGEGGRVWSGAAAGGSVIQVESSAHNSTILIEGGYVDAVAAANAIYVAGATNADVRVLEGRVTAKSGYAIRTTGAVTLSGGFVFAYRPSASDVISYGTVDIPPWSHAIVVSWNQGSRFYPEGSLESDNPDLDVAYSGTYRNVFWHNSPNEGGGISYAFYPTQGFFPLADVTALNDYGLIFDARTHQLLRADTGSAFEIGYNESWYIEGSTLVLYGFSWATNAEVALTVIGSDVAFPVIRLEGGSAFESNNPSGVGIVATGNGLTVAGSGTLTARGNGEFGIGLDIGDYDLKIQGGTFTAQGRKRAVDWSGADDSDGSVSISKTSGLYYRWAYSQLFDGIGTPEQRRPSLYSQEGLWDEGFSTASEFEFWKNDRFIELQALAPIRLISAVQLDGADGLADSTAIVLTFSASVSGLTAADITVTGAASALPDAIVFGLDNMWTIALDAVSGNGALAFVTVAHFGDFFIEPNNVSTVVFKAADDEQPFRLTVEVVPPEGGITSMSSRPNQTQQFQYFLVGTHIEVTAVANQGYAFVGWTIDGTALESTIEDAFASLDMPQGDITLTANFAILDGNGSSGGGSNGGNGVGGGSGGSAGGDSGERTTDGGRAGPGSICVDTCEEGCVYYCITYSAQVTAGNSDVSHLLETQKHRPFVQGIGQNQFAPDKHMTRAETAQMFFNLLLKQDVELTRSFTDVYAGQWHERAELTLASLGILEGFPDGSFRPEDPVTRAQFVTIAVRFAYSLPQDVAKSTFYDLSEAHWGCRYIMMALQFGWITGYGDGSFRPDLHLSRSEAVTIVNRMLRRVPDRQYIDNHPGLPHFDDVSDTYWAFYDIMEAFIAHEYHVENGAEGWE